MMLNVSRRGLLGIFAAGVGAAIVRPGLLMPIKASPLAYRPRSLLEDYAEVDAALFGEVTFPATAQAGDTITLNGQVLTFRSQRFAAVQLRPVVAALTPPERKWLTLKA